MTSPATRSAVVVGAGLMGRWHADLAVRSGGQVHAVVDSDLGRARILTQRYPGARAATRLADVLRASRPAVVHICTPSDCHVPQATEALDEGCHVIVEKPLAATAGETRRLLDLAAARGVLLCPVHQFVFQRGMRRILRRLPLLGPIRHVDAIVCSAGADDRSGSARDEVAFDILPHLFALLVRVLGADFAKLAWHAEHPAAGELRVSGAGAGVSVGLLISMSGRPPVNLLRLVAQRGTAHADLFHGFSTIEAGTVSRSQKITRPLVTSVRVLGAAAGNLADRFLRREYAYPGLLELIRQFYAAASGAGPSPILPADTMAVAEARDRVVVRCRTPSLG